MQKGSDHNISDIFHENSMISKKNLKEFQKKLKPKLK